jgi:hypothetical protein
MAHCFQLFKKYSSTPESLEIVDLDICTNVLKVPVHPKLYGGGYHKDSYNWFDDIGQTIAIEGMDLQSNEIFTKYTQKIEKHKRQNVDYHIRGLKVLIYLREHYSSKSFIELTP